MSSSSTSAETKEIVRVLLLGATGTVGIHFANSLLKLSEAGKVKLSVLVRPLGADAKPEKKAAYESLAQRGAALRFGDVKDEDSKLLPLLRDVDVVLSALGNNMMGDVEVRAIELAKKAGVKWFIPSCYGLDMEQKDPPALPITQVMEIMEQKMKSLHAVKASKMEWTIVHTGAFMEWVLTTPLVGVNAATRTLTMPVSGHATLSSTSLPDIGNLIADAIVSGRGRNQTLHFAGSTFTYDELAEILARATGGAPWTKVVRTADDLKASFNDPNMMVGFGARLMYIIGAGTNHKCSSWPLSSTYNHKHGIATTNIEQLAKVLLAPKSSSTA